MREQLLSFWACGTRTPTDRSGPANRRKHQLGVIVAGTREQIAFLDELEADCREFLADHGRIDAMQFCVSVVPEPGTAL